MTCSCYAIGLILTRKSGSNTRHRPLVSDITTEGGLDSDGLWIRLKHCRKPLFHPFCFVVSTIKIYNVFAQAQGVCQLSTWLKAQTVESIGAPWRFTRRHVPVTLMPVRSDGSAIVWRFSLSNLTTAFGVGRLPWVKAGPLQVILCKSDIGKPRYWLPSVSLSHAIHRANFGLQVMS